MHRLGTYQPVTTLHLSRNNLHTQ